MTFRPMPLLTVLSLASLVILVLLGNWQYARYQAKLASLAQVTVEKQAEMLQLTIDISNPGEAQNVYGVMDGEPVWRRYVPAFLADGTLVMALLDATGGPNTVALSIGDLDASYVRQANILMRPTSRGAFALQDQPDTDEWYTFDADKLARNLGYKTDSAVPVVESLVVTVRNSADLNRARRTDNPYAFMEVLDPLPPERHFGYALTWWGMALGLIGVYLVFHHSNGRLRFRSA